MDDVRTTHAIETEEEAAADLRDARDLGDLQREADAIETQEEARADAR